MKNQNQNLNKPTEIKVLSVNISTQKGTVKVPVDKVDLSEIGIENDAHAGLWHRQISMLATESVERFEHKAGRKITFGEFAENITVKGMELVNTHPLDRFIGCNVDLEVTQIGKKCHGDNCAIYREVGNCVMPKEGIFVKVLRNGRLVPGDTFLYKPKVYQIHIITLSDRASRGEYEDKSGPAIEEWASNFFQQLNRPFKITKKLIPDNQNQLTDAFNHAITKNADVFITTGGTGIGPKDITPETIKPLLDKEIPGIMEYIRVKYGETIPNALLTRSIAGVKNKTLVYCLPGSVKAVNEYTSEIAKTLEHQIYMLHGIDAH